MKLLDTLETASLKVSVVDLKAGNLSMVLDIFDRIGVLDAAKNGKFTLGLFHVVGPAIASLEEIGEIAKYIQGTDYVIAKNFINETNFLEWDEKSHKKYFSNSGAAEIVLPKLNEMAYRRRPRVEAGKIHLLIFVELRQMISAAPEFEKYFLWLFSSHSRKLVSLMKFLAIT